jgi:hypothetical protein
MGAFGVQIKGGLPWLARFVGLVVPVQEIFYPALAALVSPILYIIFFPRRTLFKFRPATCHAPLTLNNYIHFTLKYYLGEKSRFLHTCQIFCPKVIKGHHPKKNMKPFTQLNLFSFSRGRFCPRSVQTSLTQNCLQLTIPAFLLTSFLFLVVT